MLFHLFVSFSHMNCSIHSYSDGMLTIRMIHVHIVICYHSYATMQYLVRNCHLPSKQIDPFSHFSSSSYSFSLTPHFSFPPVSHPLLCPVEHFITSLSQGVIIPSVSADKPDIKYTSEHDNTQLACDNFCDEDA